MAYGRFKKSKGPKKNLFWAFRSCLNFLSTLGSVELNPDYTKELELVFRNFIYSNSKDRKLASTFVFVLEGDVIRIGFLRNLSLNEKSKLIAIKQKFYIKRYLYDVGRVKRWVL